MKKLNDRENILLQGFITTELIKELWRNKFLESDYFYNSKIDISIKNAIKEIKLDNIGYMIMNLYALLVMSNELNILSNEKYNKLNIVINNLYLDGTESNYNRDSKGNIDCIYHIRNAIAHLNIKFYYNKNIIDKLEFHDENKKEHSKCDIYLKMAHIAIILDKLREIIIMYYN